MRAVPQHRADVAGDDVHHHGRLRIRTAGHSHRHRVVLIQNRNFLLPAAVCVSLGESRARRVFLVCVSWHYCYGEL